MIVILNHIIISVIRVMMFTARCHFKENNRSRIALMFGLVVIYACIIVMVAPAHADLNGQPLHVNTSSNPPLSTDDQTGFNDLLMIEAYRRAGYTVSVRRLPSARSMENLNQGIDVGNGPRIQGLEAYFPNVVMVPEQVIDYDFVAFSRGKLPHPVRQWSDLADLNVAIVTGWKILEVNITEFSSLVKVRTPEQMFSLLESGRADVVIIERWQGLKVVRQLAISNVMIHEPPLATKPMFFYVHKSRANMIPALTKALASMKADGTYQRMFDDTLGELQ